MKKSFKIIIELVETFFGQHAFFLKNRSSEHLIHFEIDKKAIKMDRICEFRKKIKQYSFFL